MQDLITVIPSLEPDGRLFNLLSTIRNKEPDMPILLINDGSGTDYDEIFQTAVKKYQVHLLAHKENQGKGAALKTAMQYILSNMKEIQYMVTIDSDGQHSYEDMMKCIQSARQYPESLILGTRRFDQKVPLRSKFGNVLTRNILRLTTGLEIEDTQTGLRVIPRSFMPSLLKVRGERFEYETNMLIASQKEERPIYCQQIATTYIEENASSHFRIIADSLAIYAVFIKYLLSSLTSFIIDVLVYALLIHLLKQVDLSSIAAATLLSHVISALFNYYMNRDFVFSQQTKSSFFSYFSLVFVQILLSAFLVYVAHTIFLIKDTVSLKIAVDSLLFFLSYYIQKKYVFKRGIQ